MKNTGTLVGATVRINDDRDLYPVALQQEVKGGHHSRSSVEEMEAMPVHLRDVGMTCYVSASGDTYELANDLTTWNLKNSSTVGGGTTAPGTGGTNSAITIISGNFGQWTDIPSKSSDIFDEQIDLQFKTDLAAFPTRAITYLVGQFGLDEAFANTTITLGILPQSSRPKAQIKKYMICKNIEMYLVVETTGHVKLVSKDGLNLPVCTESTEENPYFIHVFFNPGIADVEPETFTATRTATFTRNNCGDGYTGGTAEFTKEYTSTISQDDADNQAANDSLFNALGQNFANDPENGTCTLIVEEPGSIFGYLTILPQLISNNNGQAVWNLFFTAHLQPVTTDIHVTGTLRYAAIANGFQGGLSLGPDFDITILSGQTTGTDNPQPIIINFNPSDTIDIGFFEILNLTVNPDEVNGRQIEITFN